MLKDTSLHVLRLAGINAGVAVSDPVQTGSLILAAKGELRQKPRSPETKSALRGGLIGLATYRPTQTREGRNYAGKEVVASSLLVTQALVAKMIRDKKPPSHLGGDWPDNKASTRRASGNLPARGNRRERIKRSLRSPRF